MDQVYQSLDANAIKTEGPRPPKLLDRLRHALRAKHYAYRTEQAYVQWVRRFILHHDKRHPQEMRGPEIEQFLTHWRWTGESPQAPLLESGSDIRTVQELLGHKGVSRRR